MGLRKTYHFLGRTHAPPIVIVGRVGGNNGFSGSILVLTSLTAKIMGQYLNDFSGLQTIKPSWVMFM
jgi:hypothetical protein